MKVFKGTKGKWQVEENSSAQLAITNGNIAIAFIPKLQSHCIENTDLIASAPELLEALIECLEGVHELNDEFQDGWDEVIEKAERVINKALGIKD